MPERGPTTLRSPRSRAVDIGTDPAGFAGAPDYDAQGGHPILPESPERRYEEQPPSITESGAKPIDANSPIKYGGG